MTDPTANVDVAHKGNLQKEHFPMDNASMTLYKGQFVGLDTTGYAVKAADTAGNVFVGICAEKENTQASAASAADGTNEVAVYTKGWHRVTVTAVAITDVGAPCWISDSGTCILTPTNMFAGYVRRYETTNTAFVEIGVDNGPERKFATLAIPTSSASATPKSVPFTFMRPARIMKATANAVTYPNYNTSVIDLDKYDETASTTAEVVAATDIDARAAGSPLALTLTSTAANRLFDANDSLVASATYGTSETTASSMLGIVIEYIEYGLPNE